MYSKLYTQFTLKMTLFVLFCKMYNIVQTYVRCVCCYILGALCWYWEGKIGLNLIHVSHPLFFPLTSIIKKVDFSLKTSKYSCEFNIYDKNLVLVSFWSNLQCLWYLWIKFDVKKVFHQFSISMSRKGHLKVKSEDEN